MDKDRVKGKMEDIKGRVKRQGGAMTGDKKSEIEGAFEQAQQAWGKMKDSGREALTRGKEHAQEFGKTHQNVRPKKPAA